MFFPFVVFYVRVVRSRFDNICVRLVRSCGLGCRAFARCKWRASPRSAPPAHARLTHRRSRVPCFVGSELHDRDGDVARDDRAGRAGDVGGRELCGDLSSRRGPSPAGGSQAGEGGEEPGQGEPRRLNFRSAQFMHGGAGDVVTTKLVKMLSLRGRVRPRGDRRRPIKSAHGLLSIGIVRVRRHTRKKLTQTSLSHLRMGRAAHRQYPGHPSIGSPSATRPARRRCWPG